MRLEYAQTPAVGIAHPTAKHLLLNPQQLF